MRLILLLTFLIGNTAAFANSHELIWGINVDPIDYFKISAEKFKKAVEKKSKGVIKVKLVFNEFEPNNHNHLNDVIEGRYHMGQAVTYEFHQHVPEFKIWSLPFLFENDDHVMRYLASAHAKGNLEKLKALGIVPVGHTYSGGFLEIIGDKFDSMASLVNKPLAMESSSSFLKNYLSSVLKINLSSVDIDHFAESREKVPYSEILGATLGDIFPASQKQTMYVNKTDHRVLSRVLYISEKFLKTLTPELQKIVLHEAKNAAALEIKLSINDKKKHFKNLKKNKLKLNTWNDKQRIEGKLAMKPLYDLFTRTVDSDGISAVENLK